MTSAICITGAGVLSSLGDDVSSFERALRDRKRAIGEMTELPGLAVSAISDFDASRYANVRGLRLYNRATRLGICATKLALSDAGLGSGGIAAEDLGIVAATTFGHVDTLLEYDRGLVTAGLDRTNPALMPLALPSAPGAMIALAFSAKALSTTVADGVASGLNAMGLAARLLSAGHARACVVVGMFAIHQELVVAASRAGILASPEGFRVADEASRGTAMGEAGVALVLERDEDARARGASMKGSILAHAATFADDHSGRAVALRRACDNALAQAGLHPQDIALVSAGANGVAADDRAEAEALALLVGGRPPVIAPKASLGETFDAGALLQVLAAASALRDGKATAVPGLEHPCDARVRYARDSLSIDGNVGLVTSTSASGDCAALLLSMGHAA